MTDDELIVLAERLDSHMGKQDVPVLLRDCRLAAKAIETLITERDRLRDLFRKDGEEHASIVRDLTYRHEARITKYIDRIADLEEKLAKAREALVPFASAMILTNGAVVGMDRYWFDRARSTLEDLK